jgi:hypothetical protein
VGSDERWFFLSNTLHTALGEMVSAATRRHLIEEASESAKGEMGLDHTRCGPGAGGTTT